MWLRWKLSTAYFAAHPWGTWFIILTVILPILGIYGALSPRNELYPEDFWPIIGAWAAFPFLLISLISMIDRKTLREAGLLDLDHVLSFPLGERHAFAVMFVDSLMGVSPVYLLLLMFLPLFSFDGITALECVVVCTAYILLLALWAVFLRLVLRNILAAVGCGANCGCSAFLTAVFVMFLVGTCNESEYADVPWTLLTIIAVIVHYSFVGATAELVLIACGGSDASPALWAGTLIANAAALYWLTLASLRTASLNSAPLKEVKVPPILLSLAEKQPPTEEAAQPGGIQPLISGALPLELFWVNFLRSGPLKEMITLSRRFVLPMQVSLVIPFILLILLRLAYPMAGPNDVWSGMIVFFGSIILFTFPFIQVGWANPLSYNALQSPVSRLLLLAHVALQLACRSLVAILLVGTIALPWTGLTISSVLSMLLLAWCIYLANIASGYMMLVLVGPHAFAIGRGVSPELTTFRAFQAFFLMLLAQIPALPFWVLLFGRINYETGDIRNASPLVTALLVFCAMLYFAFILQLAARSLKIGDLSYAEGAFSRQE
jgi:hypothetical protein